MIYKILSAVLSEPFSEDFLSIIINISTCADDKSIQEFGLILSQASQRTNQVLNEEKF